MSQLRLRASTEVDPGSFDDAALVALGAEFVHRVHKGWLSVEIEADRLGDLRDLPGVTDVLVVTACDDRLSQLPADLQWQGVLEADCHGLLAVRIEAGLAAGRTVALRQTANVQKPCFIRSHKTDCLDLTLRRPDAVPPTPPVARHSRGLRDHTVSGMNDWKAGQTHTITMWVGHLPPGTYALQGGLDEEGAIRVQGRLTPWTVSAEINLAAPAAAAGQG